MISSVSHFQSTRSVLSKAMNLFHFVNHRMYIGLNHIFQIQITTHCTLKEDYFHELKDFCTLRDLRSPNFLICTNLTQLSYKRYLCVNSTNEQY